LQVIARGGRGRHPGRTGHRRARAAPPRVDQGLGLGSVLAVGLDVWAAGPAVTANLDIGPADLACLVGLDVGLWFRFWLVLTRLLLARFVIAYHAPDVILPPPLGEGSQWGLSLPSA